MRRVPFLAGIAALLLPLVARSQISLQPNQPGFVIVRKVPVADSRVLTAFVGNLVDGTGNSKSYTGSRLEYPSRGVGGGASFKYGSNKGVHLTLADAAGFDAVVLRGGAKVKMYADATSVTEPATGSFLWQFAGGERYLGVETVQLPERVATQRVSFFQLESGFLGDISFYRRSSSAAEADDFEAWESPNGVLTLPPPASEFSPESLERAMAERYAEGDRSARTLALNGGGGPIAVAANQAVHFITAPFDSERGLHWVGLEASITGPSGPFSFTAVVQDPLDPRLDLTWVKFQASGPGEFRLVLDIPDQVILPGTQLWVTLKFDNDVVLSGIDRAAPRFMFKFGSREAALPEALAWRKLLLKSFFAALSEPRPWSSYGDQTREEFFASGIYAAQCPELFMTIDQAHALDSNDSLIRQYREWVYLNALSEVSPVAALPDPPAGVPAWAWYPRLAWLEARRIAEWWLDHRLVPTGEFGGGINDDSDLYQQFTDLPYFESTGVGARVRTAAEVFAELCQENSLSRGLNKTSMDSLHAYEEGINHLGLMAQWHYGDPLYLERVMESARNMPRLTVKTADGRRHFRNSESMGVRDLTQPGPIGIDGNSAPLMWHSTLQAADYNRNPRALRTVREWSDTWLQFQKPNHWATEIDVLSGTVVGFSATRPLGGGYNGQAVVFTWLASLTGRYRYFRPFFYLYRLHNRQTPAISYADEVQALGLLDKEKPETRAWLARANAGVALCTNGDPSLLITQALGPLVPYGAGVDSLRASVRWPDMYTVTEQYTDRVFPTLLEYASRAYLGGYTRRNKFNPALAVSWEGLGTDYAALVVKNRDTGLKVLIYNYADAVLAGKVRVWKLAHGIYRVSTGVDTNGDQESDRSRSKRSFELTRGDAISIKLAPKAVTVLAVERQQALQPVFTRPDLAITVRETRIVRRTVSGVVHNIGSAAAADVLVAVVDSRGQVIAKTQLGNLDAPLDLHRRIKTFSLTLPGAARGSWRLVLDPQHRIAEIYEGNNQISLGTVLRQRVRRRVP
jgi:hypothetical protein